jgi:hypothetical protein
LGLRGSAYLNRAFFSMTEVLTGISTTCRMVPFSKASEKKPTAAHQIIHPIQKVGGMEDGRHDARECPSGHRPNRALRRREKKLIRHLPLPRPPAESIDLLIQISRQGGPMGGGQHLIDLHHGLGQFVLGPQDKNRLLFAYFGNGYPSIFSGNGHRIFSLIRLPSLLLRTHVQGEAGEGPWGKKGIFLPERE